MKPFPYDDADRPYEEFSGYLGYESDDFQLFLRPELSMIDGDSWACELGYGDATDLDDHWAIEP